jgi:hypothetical protein
MENCQGFMCDKDRCDNTCLQPFGHVEAVAKTGFRGRVAKGCSGCPLNGEMPENYNTLLIGQMMAESTLSRYVTSTTSVCYNSDYRMELANCLT